VIRRPTLLVLSAALALAAVLVAACSPSSPGAIDAETLPAAPDDLPDEQAFLAEMDRSRGHRDVFSVIRDPEFVPASAAGFQPGEIVLGLDLGDAQFAYPVNLLNHHEIVEHTSRGRDLLVCW